MSTVKRQQMTEVDVTVCDRCGRDAKTPIADIAHLKLERSWMTYDGAWGGTTNTADLCEQCARQLLDWIKRGI